MRNFLWISTICFCLFSTFLSKNIASSDDLDHAYEMKDLMYDDSMNPSNLPICSGKLFKLCVGHLKYSNADYVGALKNNIPHGYGKIIYSGESAGQEYLGQWNNGEPTGQGTFSSSDDPSRKNDKHYLLSDNSLNPANLPICSGIALTLCFGHLMYQNADYVGALENNIPNGYGQAIYSGESAGQEYLGEWSNGEIHGQGMYFLSDGGIREGIFIGGNFHRGTETTSGGSMMSGEFVDGKLHNGIFTPHVSIFPIKKTTSLTGFFAKITNSSTGYSNYILSQFIGDAYSAAINNKMEIINGEAKKYPKDNTPSLLSVFLVGSIIIAIFAFNFRLHFSSILMLSIGLILIDSIPIILESLDNPLFYFSFPAIFIAIVGPLHRWRRNVCPQCGTRPHFFGLGKFVEVEVQEGDKAYIPPRKYLQPGRYTVCPMCRHKWANNWNSSSGSEGGDGGGGD